MRKIFFSTLLLLATCFSAALANSDHAAAPMLSEPLAEKKAKEKEQQLPREEISKKFTAAYKRVGEPRVAIFWNRKYDDQLSQWEATSRRTITGEGSFQGHDSMQLTGSQEEIKAFADAAHSATSKDEDSRVQPMGSYDRNLTAGNRIQASGYSERLAQRQRRLGLGEKKSFQVGAGFTQTFLYNKVKIIDRAAIMRLMDRKLAEKAGSEMIADFQKIETDALIGYADYLAEILFTYDSEADLYMSFMVSVKEVKTGRIVAMFDSDGQADDQNKPKWVVTANGYRKVEKNERVRRKTEKWDATDEGGYKMDLSEEDRDLPKDVGAQLAFEAMAELSKTW